MLVTLMLTDDDTTATGSWLGSGPRGSSWWSLPSPSRSSAPSKRGSTTTRSSSPPSQTSPSPSPHNHPHHHHHCQHQVKEGQHCWLNKHTLTIALTSTRQEVPLIRWVSYQTMLGVMIQAPFPIGNKQIQPILEKSQLVTYKSIQSLKNPNW